jgi:nucleoside-diphosphate-sugar epimerase
VLVNRLLVTGAGGFAGGHVVCQALSVGLRVVALLHRPDGPEKTERAAALDGHRRRLWANAPRGAALTVVEGSLTDRSFVHDLLAREEIEAIVHLAGRTNVRDAEADRAGTIRANVVATQVLVDEANRLSRTRVQPIWFVFASTVRVFAGLAARSDLPGAAQAPAGVYARTKLEAEAVVQRATGLDVAIVYAPNLLGPGSEGTVIPTWVERALAGDPLEIWGDGSEVLDFLPVRSFADELIGFVHEPPLAGRVRRKVLPGTIRVSLDELARAVCASLARLAPLDDLGAPARRDYQSLVTFV